MSQELNLFYKPLQKCGCETELCSYYIRENKIKILCVILSIEFIQFLSKTGYLLDASIKEGEKICLCVYRWLDAYSAGVAPKIIPEATHIKTLEYIPMDILSKYF